MYKMTIGNQTVETKYKVSAANISNKVNSEMNNNFFS
ncbi:MAG: hypothetical protein PWQ25_1622 [Deferribacteres bacterium]|jgi:hypothetical protein|nr:hypothetical protein [Deferribacteres bacterium]